MNTEEMREKFLKEILKPSKTKKVSEGDIFGIMPYDLAKAVCDCEIQTSIDLANSRDFTGIYKDGKWECF